MRNMYMKLYTQRNARFNVNILHKIIIYAYYFSIYKYIKILIFVNYKITLFFTCITTYYYIILVVYYIGIYVSNYNFFVILKDKYYTY